MSDPAKPQLYPRYCFQLAPTVNAWCFLRAREVHALDQHAGFEGENFFFFRNLPIKWVRVVGVVVAIEEFFGRRVYTLDDSSGACIECTTLISPTTKEVDDAQSKGTESVSKTESVSTTTSAIYVGIKVGSVIDVKGGISVFRDEKQINIEKVTLVRCTAQEVALWEKRTRFRQEVLDKPWVLRTRDIRTCREEAEHSEEKAERKRKRLKAMMGAHVTTESAKASAEDLDRKPSISKEGSSSSKKGLDLRQILQDGGHGKYGALGL